MALEGLASVLEPVAVGIIQLTFWLVARLSAPVKFVCSSTYRNQRLMEWKRRPWVRMLHVSGNVVILLVFGWLVWFWWGLVASAIEDRRHPERVQQREAKWQRLEEMVKKGWWKRSASSAKNGSERNTPNKSLRLDMT